MKGKLSYMQLYNELDTLNTDAFDSLLNEDFEGFQSVIDKFMDSGITEQKEFAAAREAYRFSSMPFTLDGIWVGVDKRNPMAGPIASATGWFIQELNEKDVQTVYAQLIENKKADRGSTRLIPKRIDALEQYKELYKDLYKDIGPTGLFTIPLVSDVGKHQMAYISRVTKLAAIRSRFCLTYDFTCPAVNNRRLIDNEKLKQMSLPEKMKYLTQTFANLYDPTANKNKKEITDYFTFRSFDGKILASNYLQGKGIDRKNWKNYTKGRLPKDSLFYLELAFYLSIPSSDEIEKFMNLHGYSIKSPMTHFMDVSGGKYPVLYRDLCRWIDTGIDYNLVNEICGFQLQQKEIRKPKVK